MAARKPKIAIIMMTAPRPTNKHPKKFSVIVPVFIKKIPHAISVSPSPCGNRNKTNLLAHTGGTPIKIKYEDLNYSMKKLMLSTKYFHQNILYSATTI